MSPNGCRATRRLLAAALLVSTLAPRLPADIAAADEPPRRPSVSQERIDLFIAMLKRRAQQALETHRPPPPPILSASADLSQGYESNVNLDGQRRGDVFTQETAGVAYLPRWTTWASGEFSYDLLNTHYTDLRDANIWMNTVAGMLQLKPHPRLQWDVHYELSDVEFPYDTSNSFADQRAGLRVRIAHTRWLTSKTGWTYQFRDYESRSALDGAGNNRPDAEREDQRHTITHEFLLNVSDTSAKLAASYYHNASNDSFQDYYEWDDYQLQGVLSRVFGPRWVGTVISSYERRNYEARNVPSINVAERDGLLTLAGSLSYLVHEHSQVSYSVTYRYQDSNDPRLDFTDWINQVRLSVFF